MISRLAGVAFVAVASLIVGCAGDAHVAAAPNDSTNGVGSGADASAAAAPAPRTADLRVLLTDAPAVYDHVWVDLAEIDAHAGLADTVDGGTVDALDGGTGDGGWLTITVPAQRVDLLTLQNGATMDLGGATIPAGTYDNLRFVVTGGAVTVAGADYDLKIPSGAQTGIKVPLGATLDADVTSTLTLDFDAERSVVATNGSYLLKPVILVKSRSDLPRPTNGQ